LAAGLTALPHTPSWLQVAVAPAPLEGKRKKREEWTKERGRERGILKGT